MPGKCDVIVPVYNQPHWLNICLEELHRNTPAESLGTVFLIDDGSDSQTKAVLNRCLDEYPNLQIITHDANLGFARSVNDGFARSTADYVFLLNTDCLLTPDAIPKLIAHCQRDTQIGLISPFSNNSEPLTYAMRSGYSYRKMNDLFTDVFAGMCTEACTIVGNALLLTKDCLAKTGTFDTTYGRGYGEETDFQFRAMKCGFKGMAAMDTYVYHHGGDSFGETPATVALRAINYERFMDRWGKSFRKLSKRVPPSGPRVKIHDVLEKINTGPCRAAAMFVMASLDQTAGGCHAVVDICNMAARRGIDIQLGVIHGQQAVNMAEPMFFRPICFADENEFVESRDFQPQSVIATLWITAFPCREYARQRSIPFFYFVQGYEFFFDNGVNYRGVEESFRHVDGLITSSTFLKRMVAAHSSSPVKLLPLGYDDRYFHPIGRTECDEVRICIALRGSLDKGQPFLMDLLHRLGSLRRVIRINLITRGPIQPPSRVESICTIYHLPLRRSEMADIFRNSDIFVDASLHEGWALSPLEAMACGCAVVVSNSGGVSDYTVDGENAAIIDQVNQPDRYFDEVLKLVQDRSRLKRMREVARVSVRRFAGSITNVRYCTEIARLGVACSHRKKAEGIRRTVRQPVLLPPPHTAVDISRWTAGWELTGSSSGSTSNGPTVGVAALSETEARLARVESSVNDIYNSRIWRGLCAGSKMLSTIFRLS